jgi:hypothetical protein
MRIIYICFILYNIQKGGPSSSRSRSISEIKFGPKFTGAAAVFAEAMA